MPRWICKTCGNFPLLNSPSSKPSECQICVDERQYVGINGNGIQEWTTIDEMKQSGGYKNVVKAVRGTGDKIYEIFTTPSFGIGQHALLALTPHGAVLFDTIALLDESTVLSLQKILNGQQLKAIVMSHPHFYNSMVDWCEKLGGKECKVWIHEADRTWVPKEDVDSGKIEFWGGDKLSVFGREAREEREKGKGKVPVGAEAVHVAGHFEGSVVMTVEIEGLPSPVLFSSDSFLPTPRHTSVSLMYSFPNFTPLPPSSVLKAWNAIKHYEFEMIVGAFPGREVRRDGKEAVRSSVERVLGKMESGGARL